MATIDEVLLKDIAFKGDYLRSATGDLETISGLNNVKEALFRRLVTQPGSLLHRPNYGVGLKSFQNAPSTLAEQRKLALRIAEQFQLDSRVAEVLGVSFNTDDLQPEKSEIIVRVKIKGYDDTKLTFQPFSDGGSI